MSACGGDGNCSSSSGGCNSQQQPPQQTGSFGSWVRRRGPNNDNSTSSVAQQAANGGSPSNSVQQQQAMCMKCKAVPAVTTIRQHEPYCHACIAAGVQQRARAATKATGLISTGDSVLLALSGGAASAALLYCMSLMQAASGSQRPDRGKVTFQLAALHVDCSMQPAGKHLSSSGSSNNAASAQQQQQQQPPQQWQQLRLKLASLAAAAGATHQPMLLHLSDIFCDDQQLQQCLYRQQQQQHADGVAEGEQSQAQLDLKQQQQQEAPDPVRLQQLQVLLSAVTDPTGREDLAACMRDQLLQRAANLLGCTRLLRGDCASRMAVRVIAEVAKGRGFSLPADITAFDGRLVSRGGPATLQPLRETTHKELQELCKYKTLPLLYVADHSSGSAGGGSVSAALCGAERGANNVNALSERFVQEMEGSLPASIYTIIRTATHLEPFGFTDAPAVVPAAAAALRKHQRILPPQGDTPAVGATGSTTQQQDQQKQQQLQGPRLQWSLCSVCRAPLPDQVYTPAGSSCEGANSAEHGGIIGSRALCYSCNRQVLQQVKLDRAGIGSPAAAAPGGHGGGGGSNGVVAVVSLEDKMRRLRQLLPPGMLLESESEDE